MNNSWAKRGTFPTTEVPGTGDTLTERLQSVLCRIQDRPGDTPVVVSAGFLRWIADMTAKSENKSDIAELHGQLETLTRERDEARESAAHAKAQIERLSEQLQLANVHVASLTKHVTKFREAITAMTEKSAATRNT